MHECSGSSVQVNVNHHAKWISVCERKRGHIAKIQATLMLVMEVAERHEHYCDRAGAGAGAGAVSTTVPPNKSTGVRL